jgi:GTPase SAR1 family protein
VGVDLWVRFNSLVKMYYRDVQCGIVVYDVTNSRALARLGMWIQPLKEGAVDNAVFLLIANKIDGARKVRCIYFGYHVFDYCLDYNSARNGVC